MKAFLLFILGISLYANDIQTLIDTAHKNNPSLKKLELQIKASDYRIKNSDLYKNPVLAIGVNDIQLDEPTSRDIEAMQTNYINISQEITDSSKIEQKTKIAKLDKKILQYILKDKKDQISKDIYNIAYNIQELKQKINLNKTKIQNIQKIKNYHSNHIQHKRAFQISLQNDLMIDTLNLMILEDEQKIDQYHSKLSEIVNSDIKTISEASSLEFEDSIKEHSLLVIEELTIQKAHSKKLLAKQNESSDYTISAGYYQRERFDDYVNVAIKFPLNIYKKESNELQIALKEFHISKSKYDEVKNKLEKLYKIEVSKNKLSSRSLKYIKQIDKHLQKEKQLISNQNTADSLIELLSIENKIIENDIKYLSTKKAYNISSLNLAYLTSSLSKE